jgi:hypothetical protein
MAHRTSLSRLAGLATPVLVLMLACSRPSTPAPAPAPEPAQPGTPPPAPEPAQPAGTPADELPAPSFGAVPGWLGFTVRPAEQRAFGWTPAHPNASAVILGADAWSEAVEEGTRFHLISQEGDLPLTLSEVSEIPYGCDGNPNVMAAFRTPHDLAEQAVWILPEDHAGAQAIAVTAGASSKKQRSYTAGPLSLTVKLDGKRAGRLEVKRGSEVLRTQPFEKPDMQGADKAPLDLTKELEIGVPYPAAAFRIDPALTILVLRTLSYEGVTFEVLALRDTLESAGTQYVYLCAF